MLVGQANSHTGAVNDIVFSADGVHLYAAGADGAIRVWHVEERSLKHTLEGHTAPVNALALSESGSFLLSVSDDTTARLCVC